MSTSKATRFNSGRRDPERGAALIVALVALVALLGIGAVTMLAVQSDTSAAGHDRFQSVALYAAESGVAAGIDFLRNNCNTNDLYTAFMEPGNVDPQSPSDIYANGAQPGDSENPFGQSGNTWYEVWILNNVTDPGLATGDDTDGIVTMRVVGHGPSETQVTLQLDVQSPLCLANFCATAYAQGFVDSVNSTVAACASEINLGSGLRSIDTP